MRLFIWGAGGSAEMFLHCIKCIDNAFGVHSFEYDGRIDRDAEKLSHRFGYKVFSPEEIDWNKKPKVVLTMENPESLFSYMEEYGYKYNIEYWTASSYLLYYYGLLKREDEDNRIMRSIITDCFEYNKSRMKRTWMLSELVFGFLVMRGFDVDADFYDLIFERTSLYITTNKDAIREVHNANNKRGLYSCSPECMSLFEKNIDYFCSKNGVDRINIDYVFDYNEIYLIAPEVYILINDEEAILISNPFICESFLYFKDLTIIENNVFYKRTEHMLKKRIVKHFCDSFYDSERDGVTKGEIQRLKRLYPESEEQDYLLAVILAKEGKVEESVWVLKVGLKKRELHEGINLLLADLERRSGNYIEAIKHYSRAMIKNSNKDQLWMLCNDGSLNAEKNVKDGIEDCIIKYSNGDEDRIKECMSTFAEEILVDRRRFTDKQIVYDKGRFFAIESPSANRLVYDDGTMDHWGGVNDNGIEYVEAELTRNTSIDASADKNCRLSIMRMHDQDLVFEYKGDKVVYKADNSISSEIGKMVNRFTIGKWVNLKISDRITISSDSDFAISKPFFLNNSIDGPRIIINIFVDALAYDRIRGDLGKYMPNTKKFFEKGCIFDNCYSVGEWTQTNYPSMFLGIQPSRMNAFHPRVCCAVENKYRSIIQFAREKGYYCSEYVSDAADVKRFYKMGPTKGYHRQVVENRMPIEKAINSIMASDSYECNSLYTVHCLDVHDNPFDSGEESTSFLDVGRLDFEVVEKSDSYLGESLWDFELAYSSRNEIFLEGVRQFDEKIEALYDYLSRTYSDQEMFVSLFSDHGAFGAPYKIDRVHTRTALMTRGYMTPQRGTIDDEIISNMDLFSIYQKVLDFDVNYDIDSSVPRVYGGSGRNYSISEWRYPGQPCRIAVNTIHNEMIIESIENTTDDGRVDFDNSICVYLSHGSGDEYDINPGVSVDEICLEYIKKYDW